MPALSDVRRTAPHSFPPAALPSDCSEAPGTADAQPYDAIVVGAGPAGATCAWYLAQRARRVLLLDRATFPRDKACGDAISRTRAVPVLREMGLGGRLDALRGGRCSELLVGADGGAEVRIPAPQPARGAFSDHLICRRADFDAWLLDQVRPLVEVREHVTVTGVVREGNRVAGVLAHAAGAAGPEPIRARVVVGADGAHSAVARHAGFHFGGPGALGIALRAYVRGWTAAADRMEFLYLNRLLPGCFWAFPFGDGSANVGIGLLRSDVDRTPGGLTALFWQVVQQHPTLRARFAQATLEGPVRGWPLPGWHGRRRLSGDGVVLVGDAAWLVDPVTGEGIGNAMVSGRAAAMAISEALVRDDVSAAALRAYDRAVEAELGRDLALKRLLQRLLRHGWFVRGALRAAQSHAGVARLLRVLVVTSYTERHRLWSARGLTQLLRLVAAGAA
jgi:geranylgeranyl reductase family protein